MAEQEPKNQNDDKNPKDDDKKSKDISNGVDPHCRLPKYIDKQSFVGILGKVNRIVGKGININTLVKKIELDDVIQSTFVKFEVPSTKHFVDYLHLNGYVTFDAEADFIYQSFERRLPSKQNSIEPKHPKTKYQRKIQKSY